VRQVVEALLVRGASAIAGGSRCSARTRVKSTQGWREAYWFEPKLETQATGEPVARWSPTETFAESTLLAVFAAEIPDADWLAFGLGGNRLLGQSVGCRNNWGQLFYSGGA
jgi:hypothetical protein